MSSTYSLVSRESVDEARARLEAERQGLEGRLNGLRQRQALCEATNAEQGVVYLRNLKRVQVALRSRQKASARRSERILDGFQQVQRRSTRLASATPRAESLAREKAAFGKHLEALMPVWKEHQVRVSLEHAAAMKAQTERLNDQRQRAKLVFEKEAVLSRVMLEQRAELQAAEAAAEREMLERRFARHEVAVKSHVEAHSLAAAENERNAAWYAAKERELPDMPAAAPVVRSVPREGWGEGGGAGAAGESKRAFGQQAETYIGHQARAHQAQAEAQARAEAQAQAHARAQQLAEAQALAQAHARAQAVAAGGGSHQRTHSAGSVASMETHTGSIHRGGDGVTPDMIDHAISAQKRHMGAGVRVSEREKDVRYQEGRTGGGGSYPERQQQQQQQQHAPTMGMQDDASTAAALAALTARASNHLAGSEANTSMASSGGYDGHDAARFEAARFEVRPEEQEHAQEFARASPAQDRLKGLLAARKAAAGSGTRDHTTGGERAARRALPTPPAAQDKERDTEQGMEQKTQVGTAATGSARTLAEFETLSYGKASAVATFVTDSVLMGAGVEAQTLQGAFKSHASGNTSLMSGVPENARASVISAGLDGAAESRVDPGTYSSAMPSDAAGGVVGAASFLSLVDLMSEGLVSAGTLYRHLPGGTAYRQPVLPDHITRAHRTKTDGRGDLWLAILRHVQVLVDDLHVNTSPAIFQHAAVLVPRSLREERPDLVQPAELIVRKLLRAAVRASSTGNTSNSSNGSQGTSFVTTYAHGLWCVCGVYVCNMLHVHSSYIPSIRL